MKVKLEGLPRPGVFLIDEERKVESIPFKPYLKLHAHRDTHEVDVTVDPRIVFKETGARLFFEKVGENLFKAIAPNEMLAIAMELVGAMHSIHHCGEIEIINYPVPGRPTWEHDCDKCTFLGTSHEHDLYYCDVSPTLIARYGSKGEQYKSGMPFWKYDDQIWAAAVLAQERGEEMTGGIRIKLFGQFALFIDGKEVF